MVSHGKSTQFRLNIAPEKRDTLEYAQAVAGIRRGLNQARSNQGMDAKEFFKSLDNDPEKANRR